MNQRYPSITRDGGGGAIIAWEDYRSNDGLDFDTGRIYAQRIDSLGIVKWDSNGITVTTRMDLQGYPIVVSDGAGGAIITWEGCSFSSGCDIFAQRINGKGIAQWAVQGVPVSTASNDQRYPDMISDGEGGAIETWWEYRSGGGIYAQRISSSGVRQWIVGGDSNGTLICTTASHAILTGDGAGGAVFAWGDSRGGVYAQRINAAGVVQWQVNGVRVQTGANPGAITIDGTGGAIIAWQGGFPEVDIFAQRVNGDGVVQWDTNGVAISTAPDYQSNPELATDGSGGAIIAWLDRRSGSTNDIYAQHVNADGSLGVVTSVENGAAVPMEFKLDQNYPNPFNPGTSISYELPEASHVTLKVYNMIGREVSLLVNEEEPAGVHHVQFDAANLSSGVYFYRIQTEHFGQTKKLILLR
jgi:hypothetical protein